MKLLKLILLLVFAVFGMESATAQSYKLTTKIGRAHV